MRARQVGDERASEGPSDSAEEFSKHDLAFTFALMQHHNVIVRIAEAAPRHVAQALCRACWRARCSDAPR